MKVLSLHTSSVQAQESGSHTGNGEYPLRKLIEKFS